MILNIWYHHVVYCLDVFEQKIRSHINMHGLFYKNTYPATYAGSAILFEDIISWNTYLIILYVFI